MGNFVISVHYILEKTRAISGISLIISDKGSPVFKMALLFILDINVWYPKTKFTSCTIFYLFAFDLTRVYLNDHWQRSLSATATLKNITCWNEINEQSIKREIWNVLKFAQMTKIFFWCVTRRNVYPIDVSDRSVSCQQVCAETYVLNRYNVWEQCWRLNKICKCLCFRLLMGTLSLRTTRCSMKFCPEIEMKCFI